MSKINNPEIKIVISVPLILEYEKTLILKQERLVFSENGIKDYLDYLSLISIQQEIHYLWRPLLKGPKDDMVLEFAVASGCRFIITFNKKGFAGCETFGISAVTPKPDSAE